MTTDAGEAVGRPARTFGGLDIGQSLPVPIGHSATKSRSARSRTLLFAEHQHRAWRAL
jgi:hypothetical protein